MHDFTPWRSLVGGALIGLSASLLLLGAGRVAGISGILGDLFLGPSDGDDRRWRSIFLVGLLAGGLGFELFVPGSISASPRPVAWLGAGGLLVGIGTRLSGGCTSGHGVCGISKLSPRSMIATLTFVVTGMLTVLLLRVSGVSLPGAPP